MTDWNQASRRVPRQRAIIDRRDLGSTISALAEEHVDKARSPILKTLQEALERGRA